jgi:flavin reductase (DIM6/NTAB) family NADH-FMN oxidoreductase RutF
MGDFYSVGSADLTASQLYDILTLAIQPRPIAFVSTLGPDGVANLAPFSFFMPGGANPPSLALSINRGAGGRRKDTLKNIEATGEFVVNMVIRTMADGMNACSFAYPSDVSEWDPAGFTPVPSVVVAPPRVAESPIQLECRLYQVVEHGTGAGAAVYVIGEIVWLHLDAALWSADGVAAEMFRPLSRLGGAHYLDMDALEVFELRRPT